MNLGLHRVLSPERKAALMLDGWWRHDVGRRVDWAVGAALLMRRDALNDIGGFDDRFFMYAEDLEWAWRAHTKAYETWFEPAALVRHVGNASGAQLYANDRTVAYLRNTHRFYRRAHGRVADAVYRGLEAVGCGVQWAHHRRRGERHEAGAWKQQLLTHLSPIGDVDGPPLR